MASDKEPENEEIHQKMITPQDASKLKSQLFELCKQADIDHNQLISYSEFESVIKKFLPAATNEQMHEMFNTMDENNDGNISYVEFLSDSNFDRFLEYCGYFTYHDHTPINDDTNNDISELQRHLKKDFSVRNAHDKQIIITQKEMIDKLNVWINTEGRPAQYKMQELQIEIEGLQIEIEGLQQADRMEIETLKTELISIKEEHITLKSDYEYSLNNNNILSEKLKDIKQELNSAEESLEKYCDKEKQWNKLETQNENLMKENERLKNENKQISERNIEFENENNLLQKQATDRLNKISQLNQEEEQYDEIVNDLKNKLKNVNDIIGQKNEEIDDLREKLGLTFGDSTSYKPIAMDMRQTMRMDNVDAMNSLKTERGTMDTNNLGVYDMGFFNNSNSLRGDTMDGFHIQDDVEQIEFENNLINVFDKSKRNVLNNDNNNDIDDEKYKEIEELKIKIMEYEKQSNEWNNIKIDIKNENDRLNNELKESQMELDGKIKKLNENQMKLIDTRNELNAIKKQFNELNVLNEMEIKGLNQKYMLKEIEIETVQKEMDEQKDKYEIRINEIEKQLENEKINYDKEIKEMINIQNSKQELIENQYDNKDVLSVNEDENAPLITISDVPPPNTGKIKNEYNPQCVCFSFRLW